MKKIYMFVITCFLLSGMAGAAERIAFVDLEHLFNEFYKTRLAKSKVDLQKKDIEAERQVMLDEITQISEEVDVLKKEARDTTLAQEIRDQKRILFEERLLELRDKQKEVQEFQDRRSKQMQDQVARMSQTIMDEIRQTIVEYAKREGLQAVIDSSQRKAAIGVFIYVHSDADISAEILAVLNSKRPDMMDDTMPGVIIEEQPEGTVDAE
ncbi:MAG TPA: OmpH family outer membrane protein [Tichowtungia sp.]|nr:OmpH family outer membrane protein [Tichowtungia sp.]